MGRAWLKGRLRAHMPAGRPAVDVALLCAVIVATLASTWSDGAYTSGVVDPVVLSSTAFTGPVGGYTDAAHVRVPAPPPPQPPEPPVPSARPATILIPKLDVHRPVESVGVDRSGRMNVPQNYWNAGWYNGGPVPGAPGDAVIEGHAGYPNAPLIFGHLRQLFLVSSLSIWPAGTSPPGFGEPYGEPRLTLITCTGPFDAHYKTYADRLVVEATYAGTA